jgi:hypothetical protein
LRLVDTSRLRWLHHGLYVSTFVLTALAVLTGMWADPRGSARRSALALAPALVPMAAIPYIGTHTRRHPIGALAAAPFYGLALVASRK